MEENPKTKNWWIIPHETVVDRLYHWPLLRQLKAERRFRYAFITLLASVIVICSSIPKIWIVTPKGMNPVVRIRGIDFAEAQIFRQFAMNHERRREWAEAWQYWRQASAHCPTSIDLLQASVRNSWRLPARNFSYFADAANKASGLIALDGQNAVSVYCAARTYYHFRLYDLVLSLAKESSVKSHGISLLALQARLLMGDKAGYQNERKQFDSSEDLKVLQLFDLSRSAAWSTDTGEAKESLKQLLTATEGADSQKRALALQLSLLVASERKDEQLFERSLASLHDDNNDEPLQHAKLWQILEGAGKRDRAVSLAAMAELVPISSTELLGVANAFEHLGMRERAIAYLDRYAYQINATSGVWLRFGDMLIAEQRWEDLRRAAMDIRRCPATSHELGGYSHFLEGLALKATGASQDAEVNFRKVPLLSVPRPDLALLVAAKMAEFDCPDPALDLALQHEGSLSNRLEYWTLLTHLAGQKKKSDLLLRASRSAYLLDRNNPTLKNNYVAALAVSETEPDLLLQLTSELKAQFPQALAVSIHHALALIQNHRTNEAVAAVSVLPNQNLSDLENSLIAMTRGRLGTLERNWVYAYTNYNLVDPNLLFQEQANRMLRRREEAAVEMDRAGNRNQVP